ncbi:MAG: ATP synthase F1 subunit delta [Bacteroidota bacterium]|nr:ATP synthase F1 subunit delta [Bacteroidota bacterium]
MSNLRVAARYAKSLYELAKEKGQVDAIEANAVNFIKVANESREFLSVLRSPVIFADKKKAIIDRILGDSMHPITKSFITIVVRKNREKVLDLIFKTFIEMVNEDKGIVQAKLITAVKIGAEEKERLTKLVSDKIHKTIKLQEEINPEILGGFIIKYDDKLLDASVSSRLKAMRLHLLNNN